MKGRIGKRILNPKKFRNIVTMIKMIRLFEEKNLYMRILYIILD
jgi:hypothetical protein